MIHDLLSCNEFICINARIGIFSRSRLLFFLNNNKRSGNKEHVLLKDTAATYIRGSRYGTLSLELWRLTVHIDDKIWYGTLQQDLTLYQLRNGAPHSHRTSGATV